jgi:hypothetical protein
VSHRLLCDTQSSAASKSHLVPVLPREVVRQPQPPQRRKGRHGGRACVEAGCCRKVEHVESGDDAPQAVHPGVVTSEQAQQQAEGDVEAAHGPGGVQGASHLGVDGIADSRGQDNHEAAVEPRRQAVALRRRCLLWRHATCEERQGR